MLLLRFLLTLLFLSQSTLSFSTKGSSTPGGSRFFLDTAEESEWHELLPLGIFHGITTNPTLLERAGHPCTIVGVQALAKRALSHPKCDEFMCQAWGSTAKDLYDVGMELSSIRRSQVVIKVPVTSEGAKAASMMVDSGVRICLTACYASHQALVATAIGAEYLAPYLGRMNDAGKDGKKEIVSMQQVVETCCKNMTTNGIEKPRTRIFVASIRDVESMVDLAAKGLDSFTFSPDIARALFAEPLTERAAADFEQAAKRGGALDLEKMESELNNMSRPMHNLPR